MKLSSHLMNLTKWQIDACGAVLCAALTCGVWFGAVEPLRAQRAAAAAREQELDGTTLQAKQLAVQVRQAQTQLAAVQKHLGEIKLDLQSAARVNQRIAEVTAAAGRCGLEVSDVRPGRAVVGPRHAVQPIEMSGTGSYPSAVQFVRTFHQTFGDSGFASFELAGNPAAPSMPASFHFRIHWYVEPPGTASSE
jgi:Tfp pilus assembly protein PilO